MNDKPTFVYEMSRAQVQIALAMNQDSNLFLNSEYCFKTCPDFVTLEPYTYVGLLRKMFKHGQWSICSMEAESGSAEN